jgi:hypothetical protein
MPFGFVAVRHGSTGGKPCVDTARTLQAWGRRFEPGTLHPRKQLEHAVCGTRLRARIAPSPHVLASMSGFVRFARPEGGVDRIPHFVESTRVLELVRVHVERDARAGMAELAGRANRIDASADQVARERVPEIVEPELGHIVAVEARGLCRSVEAPLRDVVAVERRTRGGCESVGVGAWQAARLLGSAKVVTQVPLEPTGECDVSPAGLRLEIDPARRPCRVPRLGWALTRTTRSRKSLSPHVSPRISWIRMPLNTASASKGRYRLGQRSRSRPTSSAVRVLGSLLARPRGSSSRWSRSIGFSATYPRRLRDRTRGVGGDDPTDRPRRETGRKPRTDERGELIGRDLLDLPLAEHGRHVEVERASVSLEPPLCREGRGSSGPAPGMSPERCDGADSWS